MKLSLCLLAVLAAASLCAGEGACDSSSSGYSDCVPSLPGFGDLPFVSYSGYIEVDSATNASLFYWFFESQSASDADTPLIIWLNGGPGFSSLFGLFYETGPFHIDNTTLALSLNPYSWNEKAHMLFWDQPVGTGFSFTDPNGYQTTEEGLAEQFYIALQGFYSRHPEYTANPLVFSGESYAGKYIPQLTTTITQHNNVGSDPHINLAKIAIGDGWMSPVAQTLIQITYGYWMGFLDTVNFDELNEAFLECSDTAAALNWTGANVVCNDVTERLLGLGGQPNIYDVRVWGNYDALNVVLGSYLNQESVKLALHVGTHEWVTHDDGGNVAEALAGDIYQPSTPLLPALVTQYPFMFYTGDMDMSCGFMGTENILRDMVWEGQSEWLQAKRTIWMGNNGQTAGWFKNSGNLWQVTVAHAGHILPMNQPENAQTMIYNFIFDQEFTSELPTYTSN